MRFEKRHMAQGGARYLVVVMVACLERSREDRNVSKPNADSAMLVMLPVPRRTLVRASARESPHASREPFFMENVHPPPPP